MTARIDNVRFIIKFFDKKDEKELSWGYIWNGCMDVMGKNGAFTADNTFISIEEAETHIKMVLNSGRCRDDITREYFEIIPVKQYKESDFSFLWYTEDEYNKIRALYL